MSFHVYPDPPAFVRFVAPGATTEAIRIAEPAGTTTLVLRAIVVGGGCAPPTVPAPAVLLVADGVQDEVASRDGVDPTPVAGGRAFATVFRPGAAGRGVFRVEVFKNAPDPIDWRVRFRNVDRAGWLALMWVVADNPADSRQPWLTVPLDLLLDARPGLTQTRSLRVANLGTGPLALTDVVGREPAPGVRLRSVPAPLPPNSCADIGLDFAGRAEPGSTLVPYVVASNDTTALAGWDDDVEEDPTHISRVRLRLTTHPPMPSLAAGDVLVAETPATGGLVRVDPATGRRDVLAMGGVFTDVWAVAVERTGDLVFSCHDRVGRIARRDGAISTLGEGGELLNCRSIAVEPDGGILVVDTHTGMITRIHPTTGAQTQVWPGGGLGRGEFAPAPDGTVYMPGDRGTLVRLNPATGEEKVQFQKPGFGLGGVAVARDGVVYVTANHFHDPAHQVVRFDPGTGVQTVVFRRTDVSVGSVAVTAAGALYISARAIAPSLGGFLFRQDPGNPAVGDWPVHEVSRALRVPHGLAVVPPPAG